MKRDALGRIIPTPDADFPPLQQIEDTNRASLNVAAVPARIKTALDPNPLFCSSAKLYGHIFAMEHKAMAFIDHVIEGTKQVYRVMKARLTLTLTLTLTSI